MKVMLTHPGAKMPVRAHAYDAGLDLCTPIACTVPPTKTSTFIDTDEGFSSSETVVGSLTIDTGVHVEVPEGYTGFIKSKSGLNVKHGLTSEGTIDVGYTGSIVVKLQNHKSSAYMVNKGDKISQLVILPILTPELEVVDELAPTERGSNGFGSTGK